MSSTSPTATARPLRADAARNRLRVLDAARDAFAAAGEHAQMEDVARRAGLGIGTLYRHFPDKEALAQAVLERQIDTMEAFIAESCTPDPDAWAALVRVFRRAAVNMISDRGIGHALMNLTAELPEACSHQKRLGPPTGDILRRAQAEGIVRADVTEDDLPGLFAGLSAVILSGGDWERYLDIVLTGLRA